MATTIGPGFSLIQSVLHPTDFSEGSLVAFHHALKTAMLARSRLTLLHVSDDKDLEWSDFPGVRETLERWGALPKGSHYCPNVDRRVLCMLLNLIELTPIRFGIDFNSLR